MSGGGAGSALHPAEEYPERDWQWILDLNLTTAVNLSQSGASAIGRRVERSSTSPR
ncbi:MAG: hypothetical protein ACRDYD_02440 [Acidimicrobiales bacterium]